jgi:hypothetical protein
VVSGGVGGNIAGSALKQYDLGIIGNTIRLSGYRILVAHVLGQ